MRLKTACLPAYPVCCRGHVVLYCPQETGERPVNEGENEAAVERTLMTAAVGLSTPAGMHDSAAILNALLARLVDIVHACQQHVLKIYATAKILYDAWTWSSLLHKCD